MKSTTRVATLAAWLLVTGCGGSGRTASHPDAAPPPTPAEELKTPPPEEPEPEAKPTPVPLPEGWVEFVRPGEFKVHLPALPTSKDMVIPLETGETQKLTMFTTVVDGAAYTLTQSDVSPSRGDRTSKQFLDAARDAVASKIGAKVLEEKEVSKKDQAGEDLGGRQWKMHHAESGVWLNVAVYLCGNDSWQVVVAGPSEESTAPFPLVRDSLEIQKTCGPKW